MSKLEADSAGGMVQETEHSETRKPETSRLEEGIDFETSAAIDADDPLNWSQKKKILNLSMVAFHGMMASITAAAIQSAFVDIAKDLDVSVQRASYLTSLVIAILGASPLLWRPLSDRFGRKPVFTLSLVCSLLGNVGCALSGSYSLMAFSRAISAFFISPAMALGSAVVSEMFFQKERARYMGVWASMSTLGVFIAPFLFGFVALRVSYRWIYWVLAIVNGVQFLCYLCLGSESRYIPLVDRTAITDKSLLGRHRIDPAPLKFRHFVEPLMLIARPCIALPSIAYAMTFLWATVSNTFEMPQIFPERYGFNTQQVGLQNIAFIIGNILGEQIGGIMSDKWMSRKGHTGVRPAPEYRLWLSYIGFALTCCGLVVFYVQIDRSGDKWNVTPMVGGAITTAGNQVITTILITYAVDCHPEHSSGIGVFVNFARQIWGFIGPFWFPQLIEAVGLSGTAGVAVGMIVGVSVSLTVLLQWRAGNWRGAAHDNAA